ncbi:MAG: hypothetical protein PHT27_07400 [Candidatus Izemoplasmatales bacterium]|nr:hypothetical protein [Candidatus Izemoplasmatales bacterium]
MASECKCNINIAHHLSSIKRAALNQARLCNGMDQANRIKSYFNEENTVEQMVLDALRQLSEHRAFEKQAPFGYKAKDSGIEDEK